MRPMPFQLSSEVLISRKAILQFQNQPQRYIPSKEVISFQHCAIITGTGADDHDINIAFAQTGKKFQPLIGVEKGWWLHLQCLVDDKNTPVIMMNYTWWKVVKQYLWKLYVWKNLIFCTPCFYFLGALCLWWWWEHVTSLPQGGEARKRLIAVLAVFSLGNDKQFGGTPLSQIESLQTNCNCQIAQFRTIRRFYPAAKRQHSGKNCFLTEKFWTSQLPL